MTGIQNRRVWCSLLGREVHVQFETHGIAPFSWKTGVRACSAFDPPKAVACRRCCLDATYRHQWPPALPVLLR